MKEQRIENHSKAMIKETTKSLVYVFAEDISANEL